jgi:hypothetical protein
VNLALRDPGREFWAMGSLKTRQPWADTAAVLNPVGLSPLGRASWSSPGVLCWLSKAPTKKREHIPGCVLLEQLHEKISYQYFSSNPNIFCLFVVNQIDRETTAFL